MSETEKLVKKIISCCLSGYHHNLLPIEYTQDSPTKQIPKLDLDDFINSVCRNELEIIYHQIEKECEDEMEHHSFASFPVL